MAVAYPTDRVQPAVRPPGGSRGWRRLVVGGAPILAVVAVMAIAAVIASTVYDTNRRGAVTLSNDLLDAIDQRIAIQMGAYLAPAEQFLESARAIGGERGVFDGAVAAEPFVLATLGRHRQIAGFSYGDPEGNFLYISRNAQGGLDTKLVDRRDAGHRITWIRRDKDGAVVGTTEDPSDTFDPRARGWYQGAMNEGHAFWTTPYIFFTVKRPGITYALPQYAADRRLVAVLGIDIELSALSSFLKSLEIGLHGKALVIDAKGRVIAFPSDSWIANPKEGAALPQLDELGDPLLTRIYNQLKVEHFQLWLALTEMTQENGLLMVSPESHKLGLLPHEKVGRHLVCARKADRPQSIEANPGDVIVFSSLMMHHTPPNRSPRRRWAYVAEYMLMNQYDPFIKPPYFVAARNGNPSPRFVQRAPGARSLRNQLVYLVPRLRHRLEAMRGRS